MYIQGEEIRIEIPRNFGELVMSGLKNERSFKEIAFNKEYNCDLGFVLESQLEGSFKAYFFLNENPYFSSMERKE